MDDMRHSLGHGWRTWKDVILTFHSPFPPPTSSHLPPTHLPSPFTYLQSPFFQPLPLTFLPPSVTLPPTVPSPSSTHLPSPLSNHLTPPSSTPPPLTFLQS
ncbi:hypothetical protein Pcinc_021849 [Petrolisthes cinctipes]|uniref:Uncharacterized protein n=1 Tax=Petrolisthes cinctipes TaxID=88211 RepID=A0AAE1FJ02_PETCI|nr:hypothetical protein Pcinc_021849 [Petrolisthes cinctipes]